MSDDIRGTLKALSAYIEAASDGELKALWEDFENARKRRDLPSWMESSPVRRNDGSVISHRVNFQCSRADHDSVTVLQAEGLFSIHSFGVCLLDKPRVQFLRQLCEAYLGGNLSGFLTEIAAGIWEPGELNGGVW